jgi:hypothetical protein
MFLPLWDFRDYGPTSCVIRLVQERIPMYVQALQYPAFQSAASVQDVAVSLGSTTMYVPMFDADPSGIAAAKRLSRLTINIAVVLPTPCNAWRMSRIDTGTDALVGGEHTCAWLAQACFSASPAAGSEPTHSSIWIRAAATKHAIVQSTRMLRQASRLRRR